VSVVLSIAPPDGWLTWRKDQVIDWFTNARLAKRSVGLSSEVDSLKVAVLFRLENGTIVKKFPTIDELHFGSGVLPSGAMRRFLSEAAKLATQLRGTPVTEVLSLQNYLDRLDLKLAPDRLEAQKRREWKRVLSGATLLSPLNANELDFHTRSFLGAYPNRRRLTSAWDLFAHVVKAYRDVGKHALRRHHGVMMS
jgi:hypothetical protein